MTNTATLKQPTVLNTQELLEHWQGHRLLTRRVIEAFPEDKLFSFSIGGMRPFSDLVLEFLSMAAPGTKGIATGKWESWQEFSGDQKPKTKQELLELWDEATRQINEFFPQIPEHRLTETDKAFGQWDGTGTSFLFYFIDNEIHHRGQGYVYLRALGIEPPGFWDR